MTDFEKFTTEPGEKFTIENPCPCGYPQYEDRHADGCANAGEKMKEEGGMPPMTEEDLAKSGEALMASYALIDKKKVEAAAKSITEAKAEKMALMKEMAAKKITLPENFAEQVDNIIAEAEKAYEKKEYGQVNDFVWQTKDLIGAIKKQMVAEQKDKEEKAAVEDIKKEPLIKKTKILLLDTLRFAYNFATDSGKRKLADVMQETKIKSKELITLLKQDVIKTLKDDVSGLWTKEELADHEENFGNVIKNEFTMIFKREELSIKEKEEIIQYLLANLEEELPEIKKRDEKAIAIIKDILFEFNLLLISHEEK